MKIKIELIDGVEGECLIINNYRVCGPKPWGGGKVRKMWIVDSVVLNEALGIPIPAYARDVSTIERDFLAAVEDVLGVERRKLLRRLFWDMAKLKRNKR